MKLQSFIKLHPAAQSVLDRPVPIYIARCTVRTSQVSDAQDRAE
jgi:hypothetical protein